MNLPKASRLLQTAALAATGLTALAGCAVSGQLGGPGARPSSRTAPAPARTSAAGPQAAAPLARVHDPGQVTGTLAGPCQARDNGRLPDRRCTPGAVDPAVTQASIRSTICSSGYTQTVRPPEGQTESFKFDRAYPAYSIPHGTESELDHLVPLELGGANDAANLWPEVGSLPNPKDSVENALNAAVCTGRVGLARAQLAIAVNWETAEFRLGLTATAPSRGPTRAPTPGPTRHAGSLRCEASVSDSSPADHTTVTVRIRAAAGAHVTTVAHYKSTDNRKATVADAAGQATVGYDIGGATPGYTVRVDVTASEGSRTARCATSFTPVG